MYQQNRNILWHIMDHSSPAKPDASVELSPSTTALDTSNDQRRRRYGSIHRINKPKQDFAVFHCTIVNQIKFSLHQYGVLKLIIVAHNVQ